MKEGSFLDRISETIEILWLYIAGVIAVGTMYFLLTGIEQGIDVVILAGEYIWQAVFSIVAIALWAYVLWYSGRLLSYKKQVAAPDISSHLLQLLPRLLAYNCFVCLQVAIFSLPTMMHFMLGQILLFIAGHNLYYYFLDRWLGRKERFAAAVCAMLAMVMLGSYIWLMLLHADKRNGPERHMFWLPVIGAVVFVKQTALVYYFIKRRCKIDKLVAMNATGVATRNRRMLLKLNVKFAQSERYYVRLFTVVSLVMIMIYFSGVFNYNVASEIGPLAFVILAMAVVVGFSNLISYLSIKVRFNLFLFIILLAVVIGKWGDPYEIRRVEPVGKSFYESRPGIKTYLYRWVKKREHILARYDSVNRFPVYVVLSDGGASRAGNWVCSTLSSLQDSSLRKDPSDAFSDHLLAISGASGGSVGNAAFYSLLRARQQGIFEDGFSRHAAMFFDGDFLTFTIARLFGPDFFRHLAPVNLMMDRGAALETVLAHGSADPVIDTQLGRPMSYVLDTGGTLPIIFITTTRVQDGMPCIIGSTQLPVNSQRKDVTSLFGNTDIRFATAAILSSRFPYVSPAGNINNNYFVDGGYVDNAGSGIMLDFLNDLVNMAGEKPDSTNDTLRLFEQYRHRISFHVIHIFNSPVHETKFARINPLTNDLFTPVLTLAGMQGSSTLIYTESLKQYFKVFNNDTRNAIIDYSLYVNGEQEEDYPMSWVTSDYQLDRMHKRLVNANVENKDKFWFLK